MLINNKLCVDKILGCLFLFVTIIDGLAIGSMDTTLVSHDVTALLIKLKYAIVFIMIAFLFKVGIKKGNAYLCVLPIIYWIVLFINERSDNIEFNILTPLLLSMFCLLNNNCKRWVFEKYRLYIILVSICGIVASLSPILPLGFPYRVVEYYGNETAVYLDFKFSYIYINDDIPRLCGLFNEPGYFGTITALMLIADGCRLKHWGNIVILIAGGLSLSLAFFLLIVLYFVLRQVKNTVRLVVTISIFVLFIVSIPNIKVDNPGVQRLINRFYVEDGNMAGNNRTSDQFEMVYESMFDDGSFLFGRGTSYLQEKRIGAGSYKAYVMRFGIIGYFFLIAPLLYFALCFARKNYMALIFTLCFFISIYQRPHVYAPTYFVILFGGILYILSMSKSKSHIKQLKICGSRSI